MVCIGKFMDVKTKMEELIESRFPKKLSTRDIVSIANEYEMMLTAK